MKTGAGSGSLPLPERAISHKVSTDIGSPYEVHTQYLLFHVKIEYCKRSKRNPRSYQGRRNAKPQRPPYYAYAG